MPSMGKQIDDRLPVHADASGQGRDSRLRGNERRSISPSGTCSRAGCYELGPHSASLPGLTRQSIFLRQKMDARIKSGHDAIGWGTTFPANP